MVLEKDAETNGREDLEIGPQPSDLECQKYTAGKKEPLQQMALGKLETHM